MNTRQELPCTGVFDARDLHAAGNAEGLAEQMHQAVERGLAAINSRTPAQQLEHENKLLSTLLAGSGERLPAGTDGGFKGST